MELHTFNVNSRMKRRHRVGRGGKRGTTSGRGTKGQKSRAGRVIRPAQRDLILRLPKRRGFRNKPMSEKALIITLSALEKFAGETVTKETLKKAGIRNASRVKVLSSGTITKAVTVSGIPVSKSARMKIEQAGGKVM